MSPEQRQINELKQQVAILQEQLREFTNAGQIPPDVKRAITGILSGSSSKTAASATQAVNEAGAGTYDVMAAPDGFISIGGYNVPYIN